MNGKCVRLKQGQFNEQKIYDQDPITVARDFKAQGAEYLHIIDLDGAKAGVVKNQSIINELIQKVNLPIQVGGGIRDIETAKQYLDLGVKRIIIGTAVIEKPDLLTQLVKAYDVSRIIVSLDIKNGSLAIKGWQDITKTKILDVLEQLKEIGIKQLIVTDIAKDGMLDGPNFDLLKQILKFRSYFSWRCIQH